MLDWIRQRLTARQIVALAILAIVVFFGTIGRLNIETLAQDKGWDRFLIRLEGPVTDIAAWIFKILGSDLALGIALGAVIFAFWGWIAALPKWARRRLAGNTAALPSPQSAEPPAQIDGEIRRDLSHLLNFAVDHATVMVLEDLIRCAPTLDAEEPIKAGHMSATEKSAFEYIQKVKGRIPTDHRRSSLISVLQFAEHDAEDEIRKTPPEQRPVDVDPLDLRRRSILFTQVERAVAFLDHQKAEVEERMRGQRSGLIDRMELRNH